MRTMKMLLFFLAVVLLSGVFSNASALSINFNGTIDAGFLVESVDPVLHEVTATVDLAGLEFSGNMELEIQFGDSETGQYTITDFNVDFDGIMDTNMMSSLYEMGPSGIFVYDPMIFDTALLHPVSGRTHMELNDGVIQIISMDAILLDPSEGQFQLTSSNVQFSVDMDENPAVPEPSTMLLLIAGLGGMVGVKKKTKKM